MAALGVMELPPNWEPIVSEYGSEYVYYWNRYTNETTWERPAVAQSNKRKHTLVASRASPSGCFLWPVAQRPGKRSTMKQSKDVFSALLKHGLPRNGQTMPSKDAKKAAPSKGAKKAVTPSKDAKKEATKEWWRGSESGHAYLDLRVLAACSRVSKAWRAALVEQGFDYGVATLAMTLSRWRVGVAEGEGPHADERVDAPAELSKRLSLSLQSHTMASGQRLREVRQFLCRHGEISQKNATCREDASAKPFLPAVLQDAASWEYIFDAGFWLSLAALEPSCSYLSDGAKGMMWAFATPAKMPKEYHEVQEASDEVHVEDEDEDSDWGEEDAMLECRDCSSKFMFSKGEQIFYRQRGLESKPSRCKPCMLQFKKPKLAPVAEVKGNKGEMHKGNGRGLPIKGNGVGGALIPTGGGGVGGSSTYKITNREATRDMDWLCAISSMEGTQHKTCRRTDPKPKEAFT